MQSKPGGIAKTRGCRSLPFLKKKKIDMKWCVLIGLFLVAAAIDYGLNDIANAIRGKNNNNK